MAESKNRMEKNFLGTGWRYPIKVDIDGKIALSSSDQDIRESIWIILSTSPGERVMRPNFGCAIHQKIFSPITASTFAMLKKLVYDALIQWEPRIEVENVDVGPNPDADNEVLILIEYRIRSNNTRDNLVFPFYLQGG